MPIHKETKILPYTAKQILDLVIDIENYPQFLPWCSSSRVIGKIDQNHLIADLAICFKSFLQTYSSDVRITKISDGEYQVITTAIDGPFKKLINDWRFKDLSSDPSSPSVLIEFFIDFEFQSAIFNKMINSIFSQATNKMIDSFEKRAAKLYNG